MPQPKLPGQPPIVIDLTSDNEGDPQPLQTVDLTNSNKHDISSNVSLKVNMNVDTRTPSLTSSYSQTQGSVISPNTQFGSDDSISDGEMTLGGILTQCRKRKHASGSTAVPKFEPDNTTVSLTKKALQSFPEVQSLKPNIDFWTIHQKLSTQPNLARRQPEHNSKEKGSGRTNNTEKQPVTRFLNIDREEIFGREDESIHDNQTSTQHDKLNKPEPAKSASTDAHSTLGFSARTIALAKKSPTIVDAEEQHADKRTRLEVPEGASTNGAPQTSANGHTNSGVFEIDLTTEDCDHGNNTSLTKPLPSAFDDIASATKYPARSDHFGSVPTVVPPSQLNATQDTSKPSISPAERRRRTSEKTHSASARSRQQLIRRSASPVTASQRRRKPGAPTENHWKEFKRLHKRSRADNAKRTPSQRKATARQQQRKNKDSQDLAEDALAQRDDDLFGSDTLSAAPCTIQDAQRPHADHDEPQLGRHEPTIVGSPSIHQMSEDHTRQQQQPLPQLSPQWKPQPNLRTIKLLSNPSRPELNRPYATRHETFEEAAASFNLLQSQHEERRTTTILDSVPAGFGMPSRTSRMQAVYRANHFGRRPRRNNAKSAETKRARYREKAIEDKRRKLEEEFADEPERHREALVNERLDDYRQKFAENDRKRRREAQNYLTVDFIEDGAGAEDIGDNNNIPAGNGRALAIRPKGVIPACQVMEPNETIVVYAVYISEPFDKDDDFRKYMQRTAEAFLKKEEANKFALDLLTDKTPSSRQPPQEAAEVWYAPDSRGLYVGRKVLSTGKVICCLVEKEKQVFGLLDMSNKWVKEEARDMYRPRFDVFITKVIPKVFLDKEEEIEEKRKEEKAKAKEAAAEAEKQPEEGEVQAEENGQEERPGGNEEREADDGVRGNDGEREKNGGEREKNDEEGDEGGESDHHNLFSPTPLPEPEATQEADDECPTQGENNSDEDSDDDDTASVSSDATLQPSHPGGALGNLSFSDVEYRTIHMGAYTDLRLANQSALRLARACWRPRGARMDAWHYYNYAIGPSIEEGRAMDLDAKPVDIDFQVPDISGLVKHMSWDFVNSRVHVAETKLEGPRDIACDFVLADGEYE